jgi:hypothetical protein
MAKPESFRVARTIASCGKSTDDGEWYNPTLSCANRDFMLFRMNRGSNPVLHEAQREGNREGKKFFIWIRRNPLKRPDSTKGIQGNASLGAYTTRNAPAPENDDEIVADPIAGRIYFAQYFAQYCRFATRDAARSNIIIILKYY